MQRPSLPHAAPPLVRRRAWLYVVLALTATGCADDAGLEAGAFMLDVNLQGGAPMPDELRVSVYDASGAMWKNTRVPGQGPLQPQSPTRLGTILIRPQMAPGDIRIHVRGLVRGARIVDGLLVIAAAGRVGKTFNFVLTTTPLADQDNDGVPDLIDDCPTADPNQDGCRTDAGRGERSNDGGSGGATGASDAPPGSVDAWDGGGDGTTDGGDGPAMTTGGAGGTSGSGSGGAGTGGSGTGGRTGSGGAGNGGSGSGGAGTGGSGTGGNGTGGSGSGGNGTGGRTGTGGAGSGGAGTGGAGTGGAGTGGTGSGGAGTGGSGTGGTGTGGSAGGTGGISVTDGGCQPLTNCKPTGASCSTGYECLSGICVVGLCV